MTRRRCAGRNSVRHTGCTDSPPDEADPVRDTTPAVPAGVSPVRWSSISVRRSWSSPSDDDTARIGIDARVHISMCLVRLYEHGTSRLHGRRRSAGGRPLGSGRRSRPGADAARRRTDPALLGSIGALAGRRRAGTSSRWTPAATARATGRPTVTTRVDGLVERPARWSAPNSASGRRRCPSSSARRWAA